MRLVSVFGLGVMLFCGCLGAAELETGPVATSTPNPAVDPSDDPLRTAPRAVAPETGDAPVVTYPSILAAQWDLDQAHEQDPFVLRPYRANYVLPFTYNARPNEAPIAAVDPDVELDRFEVKFQVSLKAKVWDDAFGDNGDVWVAYTQVSYWQAYDFDDSSPFRESNYEPELLLTFRTDYQFMGFRARLLGLSLNHQSNGRSEPLSRSWNRIYALVGIERNNFGLIFKPWYRLAVDVEADDNPDIEDYLGNGEIWAYYRWQDHVFGLMVRNNLESEDNRGAVQLDWAFPIRGRLRGYVQYFNGYGESLLDYDESVHRIGVGAAFVDWL